MLWLQAVYNKCIFVGIIFLKTIIKGSIYYVHKNHNKAVFIQINDKKENKLKILSHITSCLKICVFL